MLGSAISDRVCAVARRFSRANNGNVAVIFTFAMLPLLAFVGAAIDYTRANNARSAMQAALDSTALMLSKDLTMGNITAADIPSKAQTYFTALYTNKDGQGISVTANYTTPTSGAAANILLGGSGHIKSDFMQLAGFPTLGFKSSTTTTWGNTRMRVAMVLDNTGSMAQNGKMAALQSAAKSMIDTLSTYNKQTGDVYVSIIPFSKDVNVDPSNLNQSWLNWTEWEGEPPILKNNYPSGWNTIQAGSDCPFTNKTHGFTCTDRPATVSGARSTSTIPSSGTYAGYICPSMDSGRKLPGKTSIYYNGCYTTVTVPGTTVASGSGASCGSTSNCTCSGSGSSRVCSTPTTYSHLWRGDGTTATAAAAPSHSTWTGCVNDRDQDYDTKNTGPSSGSGTPSTQFYAEQFADCLPGTVTPMSNQWSTLKTQIDNMYPSGNTNQAVGLAWGWLSLNTANPPIAAPPKESNYAYKDYIVLLSDGLNTQNRWSTTQSDIDTRQELLCSNVKADPTSSITIFTIQVNINNADPKSQVLQDCATDGNFQMITSAGQTADAFQNILTQISKLRLAK
ncbi:TadE/TadG family type IV pilus assembly protein [Bradyrhizobium australafricanum]|uniref:TadE/TadG family type IV pilus assembly protein n=1 Tax=Bradyrhizobium australafricanum TaxID=2821406 RepID=UPI001CE36552|nr:TadE/TadG family type IV pilus assembly protein [Bradyrhizobium australafricanum]MCA6102027.1 pilus assembly protein [Bradyrhizobium australafricanum]